jgi:hypothetical protein
VIDLVHGEGYAAGKTVLLRLPIGCDAHEAIKATCEEMLKTINDWKGIIDSTDLLEKYPRAMRFGSTSTNLPSNQVVEAENELAGGS